MNSNKFLIFSDTHVADVRPKGWGEEIVLHNGKDFCTKILRYKKDGTSSYHFHVFKSELFRVLSGKFKICILDTSNADNTIAILSPGDNIYLPILTPHQVVCLEAGDILESSSPDYLDDSYRIAKGDSQKQTS